MDITLMGDVWAIDVADVQLTQKGDRALGLFIANLETPIYPVGAPPRVKSGPHVVSDRKTLSVFCDTFNRLCLTLANNHTMDYGVIGIKETQRICKELGILALGAGSNSLDAHKPVIVEVNGKRIGILSYCETQFGVATFRRAGVAALDPTIYSAIHRLSSDVEILVVSVHGAAEFCPWPSPQWQELLRSFIDAGAGVVHGHHAHVPQGYEMYNGGVIFYGLGNFLVDPDKWRAPNHPHTLWSVVADCGRETDGISYSIKTAVIEKGLSGVSVRISTDTEFQNHSAYLSKCNLPLQNRTLLTGLWQEASVRMYDLWWAGLLGFHSTRKEKQRSAVRARLSAMKQAFHDTVFRRKSVSRESEVLWYHAFSCESHREVISTALGVLCGELDDLRTDETRRLADELMPWSVASITEMEWPYKG